MKEREMERRRRDSVRSSTPQGYSTAFLISLTVLAILAAHGCLFDTRNPEAPGTGTQCIWVLPTTVDILMDDLTTAVQCGIAGSSNYQQLFAATFSFSPDPNDSLELTVEVPLAYVNWDLAVESAVFDVIAGQVDSLRLALTEISRDETGSEPFIKEDYVLTVYPTGGSAMSLEGVSTFFLSFDGLTWKIARWVDERGSSGASSWGRYKGEKRPL